MRIIWDSGHENSLKLAQGEKSPETIKLREKVLEGCEQQIWDFFNAGGQVVIYDANNGTRERRNAIAEKFDKAGIHVIMLGTSFLVFAWQSQQSSRAESSCDNEDLILSNIRSVKISSPDVSLLRFCYVPWIVHQPFLSPSILPMTARESRPGFHSGSSLCEMLWNEWETHSGVKNIGLRAVSYPDQVPIRLQSLNLLTV